MSAVRDLVNALVAAGHDPVDAAAMVARAGAEMATPQRSSGAIRQQRYRERQSVTKRNESVTQLRSDEASQSVTNRNESVTRDASISYKEEDNKKDKRDAKPRKRNAPLPSEWKPPARALELAAELGLNIAPIEARFRDYLASTGRLYADYDAGFCNFVRNTPKFNGGSAPRASPPAVEKISLDDAMKLFARTGRWSKYAPCPEPGHSGCTVPPEMFAKYGLLPDGRKAA